MKTFIKLLLLFGLLVYLIFAFTNFSQKGNNSICKDLNISISDSTHAGFITPDEVIKILHKSGQYPIGKKMDQINSLSIETALAKKQFIDSVSCYKSPNGAVNIMLQQRLPLMRIMAQNGEDYYIDIKGNPMNHHGYVADLVVATGNITKPYAKKELAKLGIFIRDNEFWDKQIEQINVLPNLHIELVPRVGNHIISFGTTADCAQKFKNLYAFYQDVLPKVGWNKYEEISVEHPSQVVGKKANH